MIPNVVIWQLMDRVKQIRIPHPLPLDSPRILRNPGVSFYSLRFWGADCSESQKRIFVSFILTLSSSTKNSSCSIAISSRAAAAPCSVTRSILVCRGLGREPSKQKTPDPQQQFGQFSSLWVHKHCLHCYKTAFLQMKLDKHFTHLVFWILHKLDMIEP